MNEEHEVANVRKPPLVGLIWVLPLFALEWILLPLVPSASLEAIGGTCAAAGTYVAFVHFNEHRPVRELRGGGMGVAYIALGAIGGFAIPMSGLAFYLIAKLALVYGLTPWRDFSPHAWHDWASRGHCSL